MSQNFAARTARNAAGGIDFTNLDADGRLLVTLDGVAAQSVSNFSADSPNAVATAELPAVPGATNSLSGFFITGTGATGTSNVVATVTGLKGGTISIPVSVPAGATTQIPMIKVEFDPPLPASAPDTAIDITLPALGSGNLHASVGLWGRLA